jgi:SAM-dependent methyltransferase
LNESTLNYRKRKITEIIQYLEKIRLTDSARNYAIEQNIIFFKHLFRIRSFFHWVKKEIPGINPTQLLELTDLGNEQYTRELHKGMIKVERGFIPGFISPAVKIISKHIIKHNADMLIADVGSGSGELTRQVIKQLSAHTRMNTIIILAFDQSKSSHEIAKTNLKTLNSPPVIIEQDQLSENEVLDLQKKYKGKTVVVLIRNNIFNMADDFKNLTFDLAFHSFFKHHLTEKQKSDLDGILQKLATRVFEYDGLRNIPGLFIQGLFSWKNPVLVNGAVFSNLRYPTKEHIEKKNDYKQVKFFKFGPALSYRGTYLIIR